MKTLTTTATCVTESILAIDLGEYKSVAYRHGRTPRDAAFTTFDTTRAELRRLVDKSKPKVVIIEACLLAGWVHDLCGEPRKT